MYSRENTKMVKVGNINIGGGSPVSIQSMLNTPSTDIESGLIQAQKLKSAGCDIIRAAVPDTDAVKLIYALKENSGMPVVADIHFDYKLALAAADAGADKIRINPGNIGSESRVKAVADKCREKNIPIRIGVNSGSVEKNILEKYGGPTAEALIDSAMYHVALLNKFDFDDIVISMKSSNVHTMYEAYSKAAELCCYPLHLGVTEAGTERSGIIRSSVGIGGLLLKGIGDTIRVSLTDDPVKEVIAGKDILRAVGLKKGGIRFISCPTCGRTKINLIELVNRAETVLADCQKDITVAIMGCAVNGPGEAREADVGIAGGDGCGLIFKKGEIIRKVPEDRLLDELIKEIDRV